MQRNLSEVVTALVGTFVVMVTARVYGTLGGTVANSYKMLSYRRETVLQGTLVLVKSGRLELGGNVFSDITVTVTVAAAFVVRLLQLDRWRIL